MKESGFNITNAGPDKFFTGIENIPEGRELLITKDGSATVFVPALDITYRSRHGAMQESMHVFINAGLLFKWSHFPERANMTLQVFELGFGTGLNALLTCNEALFRKQKVIYTAIEPYPLDANLVQGLNYDDPHAHLNMMHNADWDTWLEVHPFFSFKKLNCPLMEFDASSNLRIPMVENQSDNNNMNTVSQFDLVYFDAFGPLTQPNLWSTEAFTKIASIMNSGAVLTTYCSKSVVRKTMIGAGLHVTKISGPYGKREMVRAFKE